ncbi:hypothetical protein M758_12G133400 [Ceratodon purpureus]|nr:hypothetical protein M758_12G133400 [Ceratodon purpureus]
MESGPVCRPGNRPRMLVCYLCGREYGTRRFASLLALPIHIPQCQKRWLLEEENKPKNERRPLPPQPNPGEAIRNGGAQAFDNFNTEAYAAFEQTLEQCPHCQRRFLPKPFLRHQNGCTAANPAKPAGTGLIPNSLTNRLVPGAVAGSMHGKAKILNSKSNTQSRPASARTVWTNEDDSFSHDDGHPGQSSHWRDASCVGPRTRNAQPSSRPSTHQGNRRPYGGGEKSHLVDMFGNLWRTHSWEDKAVPMTMMRSTSGAPKWCSQAETENSLPLSRPANPRPKSARFTSECRQSPSAALRSSQTNPRERNFLDLPALAKTVPNSGQAADHSANYQLIHSGKTGAHQRRHH